MTKTRRATLKVGQSVLRRSDQRLATVIGRHLSEPGKAAGLTWDWYRICFDDGAEADVGPDEIECTDVHLYAVLIPCTGRDERNGKWDTVELYIVVRPDGAAILPAFNKKETFRYCKQHGWRWRIVPAMSKRIAAPSSETVR